jgi:hypothetical protein
VSKLRDLIVARRDELLAELEECDAFLGISSGFISPNFQQPELVVMPTERTDEVRPSYQPPRIPAPSVIPQRTHGSSAKAPDDEAAQAVARKTNLDRMLDAGYAPQRVATRPIVDENGKPTGGIERVP